jgi:peptidoglycan hydrolase-like protein with peptidoglycan-binding domain
MAETPPAPRVVLARALGPDADFVVLPDPADAEWTAFDSEVAELCGYEDISEFLDTSPTEGPFRTLSDEGRPVLFFVPANLHGTFDPDYWSMNLAAAFSALAPDLAGRRIWLPLLAPSGRPDPALLALPVLEALGRAGIAGEGGAAEILLSLPDSADEETARAVASLAEKLLERPVETLDDMLDEAPAGAAAADSLVRRVQEALRDSLGIELVADGLHGPATSQAIRQFQARRNLPQTGKISEDLLKALSEETMAALGVEEGGETAPPPADARRPPPGDTAEPLQDDETRPPPRHETAPFYPDHPAKVDALGREAVADAIATIVRDAMRPRGDLGDDIDRTFMVHVHGRWGSGKTSILNFLRQTLVSGREGEEWVVVDYNAWRNQGHGPAWWTLLNRVHAAAAEQLGGWGTAAGRRLLRSDAWWRLRSGWAPYAVVVAVLVVLLAIWAPGLGVELGDAFAVAGSIVAMAAGIFAFGQTYRIGSARTASTFLELSRDPLRPLTRRYEELIGQIGRPVAVFVDDLDRCDAAFVVELLQSIQTLYRRAPVLYVVAADRDWVCTSYEQVYADFCEPIGEPGRPLGHLFLEKIFQLSITVPNLAETARREYWNRLVEGQLTAAPEESEAIRREEAEKVDTLKTEAELRAYTRAQTDPVRRRFAGAQAFRRMQSAPLAREREHFLSRYADLVEPNPRAMKRLVNAYGFKRGFELMAGETSEPDALVRWTVLELRWPSLAARLARMPKLIDAAPDAAAVADELLGDPEVRKVLSGLDGTSLARIVGGGAGEAPAEPTAA